MKDEHMVMACRGRSGKSLSLFLLLLPALLVLGSCSNPPAPVVGHSTALLPNLPVYDPFTTAYPKALHQEPVQQICSPADELFDGDVTELHLKISTAEWGNLVNDFTASDNRSGIKRHAHLVVDGTVVQDVGLAVMGHGSLVAPELDGLVQRSNFMITFGETFTEDATVYGSDPLHELPKNTGRRFKGLSAFILKANDRDRTYLRPHLVSEMMLEFGVPTPRIGFAALHLDIEGRESIYLGVYALHEVIDEQWFQQTLGSVSCIFDVSKGDHGYGYMDKAEANEGRDRTKWCGKGLIGKPSADKDHPFHPTYNYKGGDDDCPTCQEHLNELLASLIGGHLSPEELDGLVDTEMLLRYITVSAFTANVDDFWIYGNNSFLCRVLQGGKWRWTLVPIDYDLTFNPEFETLRNPTGSILRYAVGSVLGGQMLANQKYRSQYRDLVLAWYMELKQYPMDVRMEEALAPLKHYLRGYEAKDPNSFSKAAVLDLIRFNKRKMKMAEKELGIKK